MLGDNHDLYHELPEFKDRIDDLTARNETFAQLLSEYHAVNRVVERTEEGLEAHSDMYVEDLKKQRLHLKDQLYLMLKQDAQALC